MLRERRPDAAAGILGGPLAGHTARVQQRLRERTPFGDLVAAIRSGPPRLSPIALPSMDERANAVEFFVHHEDVRRAADGWEPRELSSGESGLLWHRLRMARFMLRKAPVGVELARDDMDTGEVSQDGPAYRGHGQERHPRGHRHRQPGRAHAVGDGPGRRGTGPDGWYPACGEQARRANLAVEPGAGI